MGANWTVLFCETRTMVISRKRWGCDSLHLIPVVCLLMKASAETTRVRRDESLHCVNWTLNKGVRTSDRGRNTAQGGRDTAQTNRGRDTAQTNPRDTVPVAQVKRKLSEEEELAEVFGRMYNSAEVGGLL